MRANNFHDTEYLSYYYTKIRHEDPWNERVRHTREVKVGEDSDGNPIYETEVYYTTEYHRDKWLIYSNKGGLFDEKSISREEYNSLRKLWNTPMRFIDMHRDYYTIDGDAQEYDFCGHWDHLRGFTEESSYENRIKGSHSILKEREISKEEATELGLKEYSLNPIIGIAPTKAEKQKIEYLNCFYGRKKQIHIFILCFYNKGAGIVEDQKAYWQGGNKNELVICIGLKPNTRQIQWAESFSWQDDITLDARIKSWLIEQKTLNIENLGNYIERNLRHWKRKEFKDYEYIQSYLTHTQNMIILWTMIILSIVLGILQIKFIYEYTR